MACLSRYIIYYIKVRNSIYCTIRDGDFQGIGSIESGCDFALSCRASELDFLVVVAPFLETGAMYNKVFGSHRTSNQ